MRGHFTIGIMGGTQKIACHSDITQGSATLFLVDRFLLCQENRLSALIMLIWCFFRCPSPLLKANLTSLKIGLCMCAGYHHHRYVQFFLKALGYMYSLKSHTDSEKDVDIHNTISIWQVKCKKVHSILRLSVKKSTAYYLSIC